MKYQFTIYYAAKNDVKKIALVKFFKALGTKKKHYLRTLILLFYPDAIDEHGNPSKDFKKVIEKYEKPYDTSGKKYDDYVFINWSNNHELDIKCLQIFKLLKGGTVDFITDIMYRVYSEILENTNYPLLEITKNTTITKAKTTKPTKKELSSKQATGNSSNNISTINEDKPVDDEDDDYEDPITEEEIEALNALDPTGYLQDGMDALMNKSDDFGFR